MPGNTSLISNGFNISIIPIPANTANNTERGYYCLGCLCIGMSGIWAGGVAITVGTINAPILPMMFGTASGISFISGEEVCRHKTNCCSFLKNLCHITTEPRPDPVTTTTAPNPVPQPVD